MYGAEATRIYRGVNRTAHPPHIFAIADAAYQVDCLPAVQTATARGPFTGQNGSRGTAVPLTFGVLLQAIAQASRESQVCVISGESGAGKTESTKLIIKHILNLAGGAAAGLEKQIQDLNPILEALGNAQTVQNRPRSDLSLSVHRMLHPRWISPCLFSRYAFAVMRSKQTRSAESSLFKR